MFKDEFSYAGFVACFVFLANTVDARIPEIRVKIGGSQKEVVLRGLDIQNSVLGDRKVRNYSGSKKVRFNCSKFKFRKNALKRKHNPFLLASLQSPTGLISWKKQKYRGKINLITNKKFSACDVVNELEIDDYISMLLAKEMKGTWPVEVLKAQAVAARTYALQKIESNYASRLLKREAHFDVENSEKYQVMGTFFDGTLNTVKATIATKGQVLTNSKGKLVPAFYHSKCGGQTYLPEQIWTNKVSGYDAVPCEFCHKYGKKNWNYSFKLNQFKKILHSSLKTDGRAFDRQKDLKMIADKAGNSELRFYIGNDFFSYKKSDLRKKFGRYKLPSNNFVISNDKNKIKIKGAGNGHGVGLCQYGALELARKGWNYKKILAYYFPSLKLKKLY